ncbi:MAG: flippase [Labilithrix sp.]|nr:flippase [Labilithrix sp.]
MSKDSPAVREPGSGADAAPPQDEAPPRSDAHATTAAPHESSSEGATALRNGLRLGVSLLLTWGVALVITFTLPKYLGPLFWGYYKYGFEYAATLAVFVGFGVDTYISREVAVRPKHASDFFGGVVAVRTLALLPLFAYGWYHLGHKLHEERLAAAMFGVTQVFIVMNQTFQQTLQAASRVGGLAIANVVAKVLWGGGTFAAVTLGAPFWFLPLPMLASEVLKAAFLYWATREAVGLRIVIDLAATKTVLRVAFPFFIANAAVTLGSTIDVVVLRELVPAGSEEVGWYSAAREIARLSALMSPVLSGVLVPMMSRAKHRSEDDFFRILRRGIEGVGVVSIPLTLMLALGAELVIGVALKDKFLPAAASLQWLAPTFVLAYFNVLLWIALMILDRSWTITVISFVGLALLPAFILGIVPLTRALGPGSTGMGVAMALSARELVIAIVFFAFLGKRAIDRRNALAIVKSLGICGVVVATHVALAGIGHARLLVDMAVYGALMLGIGVVRPRDIKDVLRMIKDRKKIQAEAAG